MAGRWVKPSAVRWLGGLLVGVTGVAAVSTVIALIDPHAPALSLLVPYILPVLAVAVGWGTGLGVVTSVLSTAVFAYLFVPPVHSVAVADSRDLTALGVFLVSAVVVGQLAAHSRRQALARHGLGRAHHQAGRPEQALTEHRTSAHRDGARRAG